MLCSAMQAHVVLRGGGHFLQEDVGPALTQTLLDFIAANPPASLHGARARL